MQGAIEESFLANGGRRLVVTGTCAEYDWTEGICAETAGQASPSSPYAKAKLGDAKKQLLAEK